MTFDLRNFIDVHLRYELKYLLVSAASWDAVRRPEDRSPFPPHLVVMAMESSFVHARTLYEFMTLDQGWGKSGRAVHTQLSSAVWESVRTPLHTKVLHPGLTRPYSPTGTPDDDLKDRVVEIARDLLETWDRLASDPAMVDFVDLMSDIKVAAIADARECSSFFHREPVFV